MLQQIKNWYTNDPTAKTKIRVWIVIIVVFGVLGYGFYWLNAKVESDKKLAQTNNISSSASSTKSTNSSFSNGSTSSLSSQNNSFSSSNSSTTNYSNLQKFTSQEVYQRNQLAFDPFNNDLVYAGKDLQININNRKIVTDQQVIVDNVSFSSDQFVISSVNSNYLISKNNLQATSILPDYTDLVYYPSAEKYIASKVTTNTLEIRSFVDPKSTVYEAIDTINLNSITDQDNFQVKVLNGKLFLFRFYSTSQLGKLDIWQIEKSSSKKIKAIEDLLSYTFSSNSFMYNTGKGSTYNAYVANFQKFNQQKDGYVKEIKISDYLKNNSLEGAIFASGCAINDKTGTLKCLTTKQKPQNPRDKLPSIILEYNIDTDVIKDITGDIAISANNIYVDNYSNTYFVAKDDFFLYKVIKK